MWKKIPAIFCQTNNFICEVCHRFIFIFYIPFKFFVSNFLNINSFQWFVNSYKSMSKMFEFEQFLVFHSFMSIFWNLKVIFVTICISNYFKNFRFSPMIKKSQYQNYLNSNNLCFFIPSWTFLYVLNLTSIEEKSSY